MQKLTCFKAYDIRGRLDATPGAAPELDAGIATRIGRAFAAGLGARRVVVGRDCRASSQDLSDALIAGLMAEGAEVLDLGLAGTEEMYFATSHLGADGGIEVTASHNPVNYNGMKMVRAGSAPLDAATGLAAIRALAEADDFGPERPGGRLTPVPQARAAYVAGVLRFVDVRALRPVLTDTGALRAMSATTGAERPMKILVNAGNGTAGPTFDAIAAALAALGAPLEFVRLHHTPDGTFPNGIPNPLLAENQPVTAQAVVAAGADMGVAWDGDFDRCFFFDAQGGFVAGEYIVALLAAAFLEKSPGATIVHDPRVVLNTRDVVARAGGRAVQARTGHAFLKQALRDHDAVYGGEMSAHHYFRDFVCCDSGMIPWLLVAELMSRRQEPLANLVGEMRARFPSSGEINFTVPDAAAATARVLAVFAPQAVSRDDTDGVSLLFDAWRFNLRASNTEPVLRLNVESRGDADLVARKLAQIRALIEADA